ncbi:MAG: outer membrane lipoprotein carrier protein LolA [Nitrospirae bacterium]|nr:outer membrane lipoprotein carrier protein LolA [Nitrospirota bacterium]
MLECQSVRVSKCSETIHYSRFTILLTFLCSLFTVSHASTIDEVVEHLQKKYKEVQDVQGKFSQTSHIKDLDKTEKYEGMFFISKASGIKMKWAYMKPRDEEVIINETDIWIYKKSEKQVLKGKFNKGSYGHVPLALMSSLENLRADFDTIMIKKDTLELKPKQQIGSIKKILLVTGSGDFPIKFFTLFDVYNNKIEIAVKAAKVNSGLEESLFIFKVPLGVEVFDLNP